MLGPSQLSGPTLRRTKASINHHRFTSARCQTTGCSESFPALPGRLARLVTGVRLPPRRRRLVRRETRGGVGVIKLRPGGCEYPRCDRAGRRSSNRPGGGISETGSGQAYDSRISAGPMAKRGAMSSKRTRTACLSPSSCKHRGAVPVRRGAMAAFPILPLLTLGAALFVGIAARLSRGGKRRGRLFGSEPTSGNGDALFHQRANFLGLGNRGHDRP